MAKKSAILSQLPGNQWLCPTSTAYGSPINSFLSSWLNAEKMLLIVNSEISWLGALKIREPIQQLRIRAIMIFQIRSLEKLVLLQVTKSKHFLMHSTMFQMKLKRVMHTSLLHQHLFMLLLLQRLMVQSSKICHKVLKAGRSSLRTYFLNKNREMTTKLKTISWNEFSSVLKQFRYLILL